MTHRTIRFCHSLIWALKFEPICNEFLLSRFLNNFRKKCVGVWNVKRNIVQVGINTLMARYHLISRDDTLKKYSQVTISSLGYAKIMEHKLCCITYESYDMVHSQQRFRDFSISVTRTRTVISMECNSYSLNHVSKNWESLASRKYTYNLEFSIRLIIGLISLCQDSQFFDT